MTELQSLYQEAIKFAAQKHQEKRQKVKGTNLPYVVHLSNVAMEILAAGYHTGNFDLRYAVQLALLHDTIEDTSTTFNEIKERFGIDIAEGVLALSKNEKLPREMQQPDSLARIRKLRKEVWAVKLADRITNLQPPPSSWNQKKRLNYLEESKLILHAMKGGNKYLADRMKNVIEGYVRYLS